MNRAYVLGLIAGVVFVLIFVLITYITNKERGECQFDERQILARGKAFKAGLFTMIGYFMVYAFIDLFEIQWCQSFVGIMLGIFLGITVFAVVATHKDAYIAMNEKLSRLIVLGIFVIVSNLIVAVDNFNDGKIIVNGVLTNDSLNLFIAIIWTVLLVVQILHIIKQKAVEREDDE
ncbi:MAG: hypothetical protein ACI4II_07105 [Acutalibacteraceae bacterium]